MSIEQLLATQNELMRVLIENITHQGGLQLHHLSVLDSSYTDFLAMHPGWWPGQAITGTKGLILA
jgi:hypothetical protein